MKVDKRCNWFDEDNFKLKELLDKGYSYLRISTEMKKGLSTVKRHAKALNLHSEKSKRCNYQIALKKEGKKECYKCKVVKNFNEYYGQHRNCINCAKEMSNNYRENLSKNNNIIKILTYRLYGAKSRARKKKFDIDIDIEYLINIYNTQDGKCYYSGENLSLSIRNQNCVSIDRINSELGYLKGNIVLCCVKVNNLKQDLSKEEFINLCKKIAKFNL